MAQRPITVGLFWHAVNSGNLGVGALTLSNIAYVESVAKELGITPRFLILGWLEDRPVYVKGPHIEVVALRSKHFLPFGGLFGRIRECDLILDIGGGDSFTDIYGFHRLLYGALSKFLTCMARRPLILSPQTIGPFEKPIYRFIARHLMNCSRAVVVRDDLSVDLLKSMRVTAPYVTSTDVAFRLPYVKPTPRQGGPTRIGINVSGLLFGGGFTGKNQFGLSVDYPVLARSLIERLLARPNAEVHLVSHVLAEELVVEDDYRVAEQLAKEYPTVIVGPRFADPIEAKSYIAGLDFFTGSRMHACIAALSSGVPVVPLAYSRKFAGLFDSLAYHHVADCKSETTDAVIAKVLSGYDERERLRADVDVAHGHIRRRITAYESLLREQLDRAASAAV